MSLQKAPAAASGCWPSSLPPSPVASAPALGAPRPGGVYKVPTKIKSHRPVVVDAQINSWLATVPNWGTAEVGRGRCYGQNGTITLGGRTGIVIDGQGLRVPRAHAGRQPSRQPAFCQKCKLRV